MTNPEPKPEPKESPEAPPPKPPKVWVQCRHCEYRWQCGSLMLYVSCPNCRSKVKNTRYQKDEEDEKDGKEE